MREIESIINRHAQSFTRGYEEGLPRGEIVELLVRLVFEVSDALPQQIVEVRDYEDIKLRGAFKYAGNVETLHDEGALPGDIYDAFKSVGLDRHIGPCYVSIKGLLTQQRIRTLFGRQMAFRILDYLRKDISLKSGGYLVCIPNMTGGVWIGDETRRQIEDLSVGYNVWGATPYARETRKVITVGLSKDRFGDYVEGLVPTPQESAVIFCFEELRNTCETTQNATNIYRRFGYTAQNGVRIVATCIFDYGHRAGLERLAMLDVDRLFLVEGMDFFNAARKLQYINERQLRTVTDWLTDPWGFSRRILPDIERLLRRQDGNLNGSADKQDYPTCGGSS